MSARLQALDVGGLQGDDGAAFLDGVVVRGHLLPVDQQILELRVRCIGTDGKGVAVVRRGCGSTAALTGGAGDLQRTVHHRDIIIGCDIGVSGGNLDVADFLGVNAGIHRSVLDGIAVAVKHLIVRTE